MWPLVVVFEATGETEAFVIDEMKSIIFLWRLFSRSGGVIAHRNRKQAGNNIIRCSSSIEDVYDKSAVLVL
jgi:hypothetical protein